METESLWGPLITAGIFAATGVFAIAFFTVSSSFNLTANKAFLEPSEDAKEGNVQLIVMCVTLITFLHYMPDIDVKVFKLFSNYG